MQKTECMAMILAGGKGSRLGALTKSLAKPGVLFGGKYRLIDFPLSNCHNSGINTVGILTQYQPLELNWYIGNGSSWEMDSTQGGTFVLPPYMRDDEDANKWYQGTADAIYQNINFIDMIDPEYVLVLSGDHIYSMDYAKMLAFHKKHRASVTVATMAVPWEDAPSFGIMATNSNMRITEFQEKPKHPKSNQASMGIYIFNKDVLKRFLNKDAKETASEHDFGKNVIPAMLEANISLYAYPYEGYWKDVGTVKSLWAANMDLLAEEPALDLYDKNWRIFSGNKDLPPHYIGPHAVVQTSLVAEGACVSGRVAHSVIFYDTVVEEGAVVIDSVILPGTVIESGAVVEHAIIGERCQIHSNAEIKGEGTNIYLLGNDKEIYAGGNEALKTS